MNNTIQKNLIILFIFLLCSSLAQSQTKTTNPNRFQTKINTFNTLHFDDTIDRIVFTGSSSIRMWNNIQYYYPNHQIINTGFGGSQMSDLHYYLEETVLKFKPSKVFIYEGDNDIANGVSRKEIIMWTKKVIAKIQESLPKCEIFVISPKPSIARWNLKSKYKSLNKKLYRLTRRHKNTTYIDVWEVMLKPSRELKDDLFIRDGLHMNSKGYDLWDLVIKSHLQ